MQWLIYKNSVQYLVMMELQLAERQRERRLLSTLRAWSGAAAAVRSEREAMAAAAAQRSPEVPPAGDESFDASFRSFDSDGMPAFPLFSSSHRVSPGRSQRVSPNRTRRSYGGAASGFSRRLSTRPQEDSALLGYRAGTHRQMATTLTYWKRFTRHHGWRRQRMQASLRFSHWLRMLACFKRMRVFSAEEMQKRRVQRHAVCRILRHHSHITFAYWARCTETSVRRRNFNRECMRRIVNSGAHRATSAAFEGWLSFLETCVRSRERAQTAQAACLRKALRGWSAVTDGIKSARSACGVLEARQSRRRARHCLQRCFDALHQTSAHAAHLRRLETKAIVRMQGSVRAKCFAILWSTVVEARGAAQELVRDAIGAWQVHTANERAFKARLRSSVWRWKFYFMMATFRKWRVFASEATHHKLSALALFGKLGNKTLRNCFQGWRAHLVDVAHEEAIIRRTCVHMIGFAKGKAFRRWMIWTAETKIKRTRGRRAVLKMLHRYISLCFNAWVGLVVNTRRIRRFVMKWLHFGAAAAFSRWAIFVHEQQRFDRLTATIAGRLGNRALSMGFAGWAAATRQAAHELRLLVKVRAAIEARLSGRAFRKWAAWAVETRVVHVQATRVILRMRYRTVSLCISAWIEMVVEARRLRSFLSKWIHFGVSGAFARWAIFVVESQRVGKVTTNLAQRLMNRCKRTAFVAWRDMLRAGRVNKNKIAQVAARLGFGGARTAFVAWSNYFKSKRDQLRQLDWVVLRIRKLCKVHAWENWLDFVRSVVATRWIMLRMMQQTVARAWGRWVYFVSQKIEHMDRLQRAVLRMTNVGRAAAFCSWVEAVNIRRNALSTLARVRQIMLNRSLARAFRTWNEVHTAILTARNAVEKKQRVAVMRLLRLGMARAFARWAHLLHQRLLLRKVASRIRGFKLSQGFFGWVDSIEAAQARRDALLSALVKMRHGTTARAFIAWCGWLETCHANRQKLVLVMLRLSNVVLAAAFFGWLDHATLKKHHSRLTQAAVMRMRRRNVVLSLQKWRLLVSRRRFLDTVIVKMQRSGLTRAFVFFRHVVYRKIQIEEGLIGLIAVWQQRSTAKCFNAWAANVETMYASHFTLCLAFVVDLYMFSVDRFLSPPVSFAAATTDGSWVMWRIEW